MTGEVDFFRKRFIGGFDRKDVVDYIAKLAGERNALADARDKAVQEVNELTIQVDSLRRELAESIRYAESFKVEEIAKAKIVLLEIETEFEALSVDAKSSVAGASNQLRTIVNTIEGVSSMLDSTGAKIAELKSLMDDNKTVV